MAAGGFLTRRWLLAVLLVTAVSPAVGCSYGPEVRGPFQGQVIDAETGEPLPDVVVVASWHYGNPFLRFDVSVYDAHEALTDAKGRFELPGLQGLIAWHNVERPVFYVFAAGYRVAETRVTPANGIPFRDPTVQQMRRLTRRAELCDPSRSRLPFMVPQDKMPRFVRIVFAEMDALQCGLADKEVEKQQ